MTCSKSNAAAKTMSDSLRRALVCGISLVAIAVIAVFALGGCGGSGDSGSAGGSGVTPKSSVEDYTWDELSKISVEIGRKTNENDAVEVAKKYNLVSSDGKLDGSQTKAVQLSNGTSATVQIAGFFHDDKSGGGKAGITFIFKDAIARHDMNSNETNSGGWEGSRMRSWLSTDGLTMLPQDITNNIVAVDKKTNNAGKTSSASSVTTTSDKLWLFSATELCGTIDAFSDSDYNQVLNAEGSEYKLFRDCNVESSGLNKILTKSYNGSSCEWWERSPDPDDSYGFRTVGPDGHPKNVSYAIPSYGVVPGFCL